MEAGSNHLFPRIWFLISKCPLIFKWNDSRSDINFLKSAWHEENRHWHHHISGEAREAPSVKPLPVLPSLWLHELLTHNASRTQGKEIKFAVYHSSFFLPIVNSGLGLFFKFWQRAYSALSSSLPTTQFSISCSKFLTLTLGNNLAWFGQSLW